MSLIWDNEGPGMFTMGRISRKFSEAPDGLSRTFLIGETLPAYSTFQMYFISTYHVGSNNSPPNYHKVYPECYNLTTRITDPLCFGYMASFKSEHPGGVNMAMSDGSVHFISENIEYFVWCVLGDRDSGAPTVSVVTAANSLCNDRAGRLRRMWLSYLAIPSTQRLHCKP